MIKLKRRVWFIIETEKMLYIYLEGMNITKFTPITVDKFGITYEAIEQRIAQGMTWNGLPIPTTSSIGGERVS